MLGRHYCVAGIAALSCGLIASLLLAAGCGPSPAPTSQSGKAASPQPKKVAASQPKTITAAQARKVAASQPGKVVKVAAPAPAKPKTADRGPKELTLMPTRDARVSFYVAEQDCNGGGSGRLRTATLQSDSAEMVLMDFDRAAIKKFLDGHEARGVTGKLVLAVLEAHADKGLGKVEVAALDSANDWGEGEGDLARANRGECCFLAAQYGVKLWATAAGKDVRNFRELIYDAKADKIKTVANSKPAFVADKAAKGSTVQIDLDGQFLEHLARDGNCRGLVLFTRSTSAKIDFYSRDHFKTAARLELAVK